MPPIPSNPEHDIIEAKINVLLTQNRRLVESWPDVQNQLRRAQQLPPNAISSVAQIEKEEQETFTPTPEDSELSGVGAKPSQDGEVRREELASNDKLRKQLLGKNYAKKQKDRGKGGSETGSTTLTVGSKPLPMPMKRAIESESDDGGRSSLGRSRHRGKQHRLQLVDEPIEDAMTKAAKPEHKNSEEPQLKTRASNYLDEVLANRSLQKRKQSKHKKQRGATVGEMKQDS